MYFYLKLIFIGLVSPLIIYFLNELLSILSFDLIISFFSFVLDNIPIESEYLHIIVYLYTVFTYTIASLLIFIPIYLFFDLNIGDNKKSILIVTTIAIIIFAFFAPYLTTVYLEDIVICYDLIPLFTVLVINFFIIIKISQK